MVVESFARGGAERQILVLSEGLLRRGYDVRVFELVGVVPGQANFEDELAQLDIALWDAAQFADAEPPAVDIDVQLAPFAGALPADYTAMCRALAAAITDFAPDVVNGWSDMANLIGGFVAGAMGVPRIVLGQRVLPGTHWISEAQSELYRQAYRQLAHDPRVTFVNCSAAGAKAYEAWLALEPGTAQVVYCGLASSNRTPGKTAAAAACRAFFGLPASALVVGGLMRFAPEKDPVLWIETAAAIAAARADTVFLLAGYGHGTIAEDLRRKATELGLGARLVMPGAITEVGPFYAALDAFLLTSRAEAFGNVLIEAQAAGVPVVAPAVGGMGETMRDGVTGRLVTDRSAAGLAAAVLDVLADSAWRARAAAKAPGFVAKNFGQRRMVTETVAIYRGGRLGSRLIARLRDN
jgi:glycosyltransferase involved in cell wall biosynthesis